MGQLASSNGWAGESTSPFRHTLTGAAQECEQRRDWSRAVSIYQRLLATEGHSAQLRDALARCGRKLEQIRRLDDPAYRAYANSLTLAQALDVYSEIIDKVQSLYPDRERSKPAHLFREGILELADGLGHSAFPAGTEKLAPLVRAAAHAPAPTDAAGVRETMKTLALGAKRLTGISPGLVVLECAAGACAGLDEYSLYLHPCRDDELTDLGVKFTTRDGRRVVSQVSASSWASMVGILPGDRIVRTGEESIEIQSPGAAPRTARLPQTPALAEVGCVREGENAGIGYIRLAQFNHSLPLELDSALLQLRSEGAKALVLDLRGVPGGSFTAAVQAAERFLPRGIIVTARGQQPGLNRTYTANGHSTDLPMVVLVDAGTASAAEVLASALKEHRRATLVGDTTFGKAAVQGEIVLENGGGGLLRLTLARLFGPDGKSFHGTGITPHVVEPNAVRQLETAVTEANKLGERPA